MLYGLQFAAFSIYAYTNWSVHLVVLHTLKYTVTNTSYSNNNLGDITSLVYAVIYCCTRYKQNLSNYTNTGFA